MARVRHRKSTIVRIMGWLERLGPALGARWVERLWFTVPPGRTARRALPPGRRFELATPVGLVVGESWGDGPIVYLLHGWGGRRTDLDALVTPLVGAGHRVVSFDAPSHGDSPSGATGPGRGSIPESARALTAVVDAEGPAHAVVAHSLGAMATMVAIADGLAVRRLVLFAPMTDPMPFTYGFARQLGFGERIRTRLVRRIEQRLALPMSYFTATTQLDRIAAPPPLLLIHDRDDAETPWSGSAALAVRWPGATLVSTSDLSHRRVLRDPAAVAKALAFVGTDAPAAESADIDARAAG
jgi:pimeloyl-ACP methyl ester carboxylesterase